MSNRINKLNVLRRLSTGDTIPVGVLAQNKTATYFQYDAGFLAENQSISPFRMPISAELIQAPAEPHDGLHGVFSDSLPDGWGTMLMDRVFRQQGLDIHAITPMDRLAYIGDRGMGALIYRPSTQDDADDHNHLVDISILGAEAQNAYEGNTGEMLHDLAQAGGSGGARPKALIYIDANDHDKASTAESSGFEPWLVKFTASTLPLGHQESLCEAAYLTMAKNAGIDTPEFKLIDAKSSSGAIAWLGLRRFDCSSKGRYHMHSLCGLLGASFRLPSMDYGDVIKASRALCKSPSVGQAVFERAIFNLLSLNQDDHSKNWSFLMNDNGSWSMSPFYDATFSPSRRNEHMMSFAGYGNEPPLTAIKKLATTADFSDWTQARMVIERVVDSLSGWSAIATQCGVAPATIKEIGKRLVLQQKNTQYLLAELLPKKGRKEGDFLS